MSYTAKTWKTGEVITASALNNLEAAASQNASDIQEIQNTLPTYVGDGVAKKEAATYTPGTSDQVIASGQYLAGVQTIKGDSNLLPGNIKSGTKIFDITGTYAGSGETTTPSLQTKTVTPTTETQNVTPDSSYDGLSQVTVNPIPSDYIIPSGNKVITANGTGIDVNDYATVDVNVPDSGGIDTSDADATASDIAEGKTAYVNGVKVTGSIPQESLSEGPDDTDITVHFTKDSLVPSLNTFELQRASAKEKRIIGDGAYYIMKVYANQLGNATAEDVVAGKTFTSAAGLKVTGTHTCSSGGGLVMKTGTTTSGTIETGLSSIQCIVIYKDTVSATGLVQAVWLADDETGHYTYCSYYNTYMKSYAVGTDTASTVSGGTFTWGGSGTSGLSSGVTYNWIAFGEA